MADENDEQFDESSSEILINAEDIEVYFHLWLLSVENILIKNEPEDDDDSLYSVVTSGLGPARKRAITSLEKQAIRMVGNSAKKFKPAEPGCSVTIPIPEFDRGRLKIN